MGTRSSSPDRTVCFIEHTIEWWEEFVSASMIRGDRDVLRDASVEDAISADRRSPELEQLPPASMPTLVIGEDDVLLREGIVRLLTEAGFDVVAQAGDAADLLRKGLAHHPSVVIADVSMPPDHADDGLRAAIELRRQRPDMGVLVLSQYYEEHYALDLIGERADGVGYLLKERVGDVDSFIDAVARVARGGSALDPEIVGRMLGRRQRDRPLDKLSPREHDVLAAMAEGKSNRGIAQVLMVSQAAVEKHVTGIFHKLGVDPGQTEHRRVLAVLAYLRDEPSAAWGSGSST